MGIAGGGRDGGELLLDVAGVAGCSDPEVEGAFPDGG